MRSELPVKFLERLKEQLGDEFDDFLASYVRQPKRGIRINTLKTDSYDLKGQAPFDMEPVPWVKNGFFVSEDDDPAGHAFYRAGLYYIQEPSAMTPADRLPVSPHDKVLDLCAAPGGKATAIAAKLQNTGLLVANDASASRCRALLHNLELAGAGNIIVTNELPQELEKKFPAYFDKIMVDAPCSGEGMFRKEPEVINTWSPERVGYFAKQQRSILKSAVAMLKDGGFLMYSTCTFSPEEDEGSVSFVLEEYPEMELVEIEGYEGFSAGALEAGNSDERFRKTVRIWPHKMDGEGHFMALFRKKGVLSEENAEYESAGVKRADKKALRKKQKNILNNTFNAEEKRIFEDFLQRIDSYIGFSDKKDMFENKNGKVYLMPVKEKELPRLKFLRSGLYVGELKKNRFEPSQAFALSVYGAGYKNSISLEPDDARLGGYFRGESLTLSEEEQKLPDGIILVKAGKYALGFGKKTKGLLKSRYIFLK